MRRWTLFITRHRKWVLLFWIVCLVAGAAGAANMGGLLSNRFSVPGSESQRGLDALKKHFGERADGAFTLIGRSTGLKGAAFDDALQAAAVRAAGQLKGGHAGPVQHASPSLAYVQVSTLLENQDASKRTPKLRKAIGRVPGVQTYVSGFPAISHDTQPIYNKDVQRGESIAIPVAIIVLVFMFGTLGAIVIPFMFAAASIVSTLGLVFLFAHVMDMAQYVTNIVTLIGLAIAIDYSMLVVFRFREELRRHDDKLEALLVTMQTAGRATLFSGMTVAIGLALLVLMPLPFMQSMGVGGLLVPVISTIASATLLPAMLFTLGPRINSLRIVPRRLLERRAEATEGFWSGLARSIMRRPIVFAVCSAAVIIALAVPALGMHITSGDNRGLPTSTESGRGYYLLQNAIGPGSLAPNQLFVDTGRAGGAWSASSLAAQRRFIAAIRSDREAQAATVLAPAVLASRGGGVTPAVRQRAVDARLVDPSERYFQLRVAGRHDSGTSQAANLVKRIRNRYVPQARFTGDVLVTGAPAFGVDFVSKAYGAFPWLVLAVLVISYFLLLRAFRSVVLPAKAVLMNLLSVSATFGVLTLVFQHSLGKHIGLGATPQIDAWIPIFLFAMLFGLSMDYEVFLLSRMREEWDKRHDNEHAVAFGLEHTGRIITAAAIIMVAAFSGFMAGSFVGLQEFGVGLAAAIFLDATIVRALLVPALMKLLGGWNWYLPDRVRRAMRLSPAPRPVAETAE